MCCQTTGQFYYTAAKPTATKFPLLFPWMRRLNANELKCAQWCILIVTNHTAPLSVKQNCPLAHKEKIVLWDVQLLRYRHPQGSLLSGSMLCQLTMS